VSEVELVYKVLEWSFTEGHQPTDFVKRVHLLRGVKGAVSFIWIPRPTDETNIRETEARVGRPMWPLAVDVGYHRRERTSEWQSEMEDCEILGTGQVCYYDGSSLRAVEWLDEYLAHDQDEQWVRERLRGYYHDVFYELVDGADVTNMTFGQMVGHLDQVISQLGPGGAQ
jgi:hypothetical protein